MKATQKDFARIAPQAAAQARVFFFCGQDDAGIQDAAHHIASLLRDPGERIEMSGAELKRDPPRLDDEARSVSLFGDSRHIWVRASGDEVCEALEILLSSDVAGCPVIVQATNATDKSRTAKLLEKRPDSLVGVFYPPDLRSVTKSVRSMADSEGVPMDQALAERIAAAVGLDTRLAASEIAKLALYLDAAPERPRAASVEAYENIGAKTEEEGFSSLVNVVLAGETAKVPDELRRMFDLGLNSVGLLLAFERRAAQLAQLTARMDPREDLGGFLEVESAARRINWKDKADLSKQLRIWRGARLERLVLRLMAMHRLLMAHSREAELLLAQGLAEIAREAARRS